MNIRSLTVLRYLNAFETREPDIITDEPFVNKHPFECIFSFFRSFYLFFLTRKPLIAFEIIDSCLAVICTSLNFNALRVYINLTDKFGLIQIMKKKWLRESEKMSTKVYLRDIMEIQGNKDSNCNKKNIND